MRKTTKILIGVLVAGLLVVFLLSATRSPPANPMTGAVEDDRRRFRPENSLDISMAMGLITHAPPQMLNPPVQGPPLMLFPPSAETLATLSGS